MIVPPHQNPCNKAVDAKPARSCFLELLVKMFAANRQVAGGRAAAAADDLKSYLEAEELLRQKLFSPRLRLLKQFIVLPKGQNSWLFLDQYSCGQVLITLWK
jgi:hypothetical protein